MKMIISDTVIERLGIVIRLMWYDYENDEMVDDLRDYVRQFPYWVEFVPFYVYLTCQVDHLDWTIFGAHSKSAIDSTFETEQEARVFFSDLTILKTEELLKKYHRHLDPKVIT